MQQKKPQDPTPTSKKLLMAVSAIAILMGILYVLNGNRFPTDITFRNVGGGGSSYVVHRENPR